MLEEEAFHWNFGLALAVLNKYEEAEEHLLQIKNEKIKEEYLYNAWLAKCHINNNKPELAWNLYLEMSTSNETLNLLTLIGNECYEKEFFYYSLKAFEILERLNDEEDYFNQKLGACVGIFKGMLVNENSQEELEEAVEILRAMPNELAVEQVLRIVGNYLPETEE